MRGGDVTPALESRVPTRLWKAVLRSVVVLHVLHWMAFAQEWVVPERSEPLRIEVEGAIEMSRSSVQTIRPGSPSAIVSWIGPDGRRAAFGDELMRLDTEGIKRRHAFELDALNLLREQNVRQVLKLEKTIEAAEEDLARKLENLAAQKAEAETTAAPDASRVATLERQIDLARRNALLEEAELQRKRNLFALGELSRAELEDATLRTESIRRRVREAELALEEAGDGSDPVLARRAQWLFERMRTSMGADEAGVLAEGKGDGKRLAKLKESLARLETTQATAEGAQETTVQELAKAAWPHVPLKRLVISRVGSEAVAVELVGTNNAMWAYEPGRGFGWLDELATAPSESALVIRGMANWRSDVPAGRYKLSFELGDAVEWNCMFVRANSSVVVALNRLEKGEERTVEAEVEVGADGLQLSFGLPQKAVLASEAGAVKNQNWLSLGRSIRNNPPALYLTPEARLLGRFRVHHVQVPFFDELGGELAGLERRIELRDSAGRWVEAGKVEINEEPMAFFPDRKSYGYGAKPVVPPEEKTAREITVAVPAGVDDGFAFAAHVPCRVEIVVGTKATNVVAVPAFLVRMGDAGMSVFCGGEEVSVKGVRFDQHVVIFEGLTAESVGRVLSVPPEESGEALGPRYTGEVVSGSAASIIVPTRSWARVESLVPHGSKVKEGDLVIRLYRPEEAGKVGRARAKAVKAESSFLDSIHEQQDTFRERRAAHLQAVQEEKLAADRVVENRRLDESVVARAAESERSIREELEVLERRVAALAGKESTRLAYEDARRRRDLLRLDARKQALETVATLRQRNFTRVLEDRLDWAEKRVDLARQEAKVELTIQRQDALAERARTSLEQGVEDRDDGRDFESLRDLLAPVDGNVFYGQGYNDLAKRKERLDKEFVVWNGLNVAQVLDISNLSFELRLPEREYHRIAVGLEIPIELEDVDDRVLSGTVSRKGRALYVPEKKAGDDSIGLRRVFDVTLTFPVPDDLRERLRPGMRGTVSLP